MTVSGCPKMSTRYYLPLRHDNLAKCILKAIITKNHPNERNRDFNEYEFVKKLEIRNTGGTFQSNELCTIVEFSCPADINITQKVSYKINVYGLLKRSFQTMHPQYKSNMVSIIVGALVYIPKCLTSNLQDLGFDKNESNVHTMKMQNIAACCAVKICKTFLRFK